MRSHLLGKLKKEHKNVRDSSSRNQKSAHRETQTGSKILKTIAQYQPGMIWPYPSHGVGDSWSPVCKERACAAPTRVALAKAQIELNNPEKSLVAEPVRIPC
jgi:hypothetical protein